MTQVFQGKTRQKSEVDPIARLIDSRVKAFSPYGRSRSTEWNVNIAYLMGRQYIGIDNGHIVPARNISPFSVTANKILPAVQNDIAQVTKIPPKFDIVPTGTDADDRASAIAGEKMCGYLRRVNNFDLHRGRIMLWIDIANMAWRKQVWDPTHKMIGTNPEPEEEGYDPNLPPGAPVYEGEAISYHVPNNEIIFDWREDVDNLTWAIHARPMTIAELQQKYGETVIQKVSESDFYKPQDGKSDIEIKLFNEFKDAFQVTTQPEDSELTDIQKQVMVYELWQVPCQTHPTGIYAVKAGEAMVMSSPYPRAMYPHGEVPLVSYTPMFIHNSITGTGSRISQARPLQSELNDIRTLIKENTIMLGGGLWKVPRDAKIKISNITNGVGLMLEYDGIKEPHREQGVPPPGQLFLYVEKIAADINEIFAFHEASKGMMPTGGPRSGVGLMSLQEADITQSSPIVREFERKDERAMRQLLSIAFANYNQRLIPIIGKDNQWTLFDFNPQDYKGKYDVNIRFGSSLPISKAYERDLALNLGAAGWLGNPMDPSVRRKVLEVIDLGGLDSVLKDNAKDTNFAKKEYASAAAMVMNGAEAYLPPPNMFDNHDVHIIEHRNDLMDHFWEYLQSGNPNLVALAMAELDHYQMQTQIAQQIMYQQAIMTGQIKNESGEKKAKD